MRQAIQYINNTLGTDINAVPVQKEGLAHLPVFINEMYRLYRTVLFNKELILAEIRNYEELSVLQMEKHLQLFKKTFDRNIAFVIADITSYNRQRLIEKSINFIVPDKQLFLPELLIDLRENFLNTRARQATEKLLPSAQFLLIYHIIHRYAEWKIEEHSFKEIAQKTGYTAMAITKAVENLKHHELIDVTGEKEKYIKFAYDNRAELWHMAEQEKILINPVLKTVFVDKKPNGFMLYTNASALPEYTDLNPSKQPYYAIEKSKFYELQKNNLLINANEYEGNYCIEVWKYNPEALVGELPNDMTVVDPLSLYLSLKDTHDERVEMALDQITDKYIW